MSYINDPLFQLRPDLNGLTLLQINPDVAIDFRKDAQNPNWIYQKTDNGWEKLRELSEAEVAEAWDQSVDFAVLDASKLTGAWNLPIDQVVAVKHQENQSKFKSFMKKVLNN